MLFGDAVYCEACNTENIIGVCDQASRNFSVKAILVLSCADDSIDVDRLGDLCKTNPLPIIGARFPKLIYQNKVFSTGCILVPIVKPVSIKVVERLHQFSDVEFFAKFKSSEFSSLLVFTDGLSKNIDNLLNIMFQQFGHDISVFGGGAGSLSFEPQPCLFAPQGLIQDAMLLVWIDVTSHVAIGHGWHVLDGPYLANQVAGNEIQQLNFQPAFDVYRDAVELHLPTTRLSAENFFDIAKNYPFGLERLDEDLLIRDPITIDGTSVICVGNIAENAMLYIMQGSVQTLVEGAAHSVKETKKETPISNTLVFDCISRELYMGDAFDEEMNSLQSELGSDVDLIGALVLGEIASTPSSGVFFHNKTCVSALFESGGQ